MQIAKNPEQAKKVKTIHDQDDPRFRPLASSRMSVRKSPESTALSV